VVAVSEINNNMKTVQRSSWSEETGMDYVKTPTFIIMFEVHYFF
jgi:hypothetical protein